MDTARSFNRRVRRLTHVAHHLTASPLLFKFGVIADIQYADSPDIGVSFWGRPRYYRDALQKVTKATKGEIIPCRCLAGCTRLCCSFLQLLFFPFLLILLLLL
jgi:hypothetical protein